MAKKANTSLPTLLIIDDEPDVRASTKLVLNQKFQIFQAESGEKAIQIIATNPVDVVVCDIRLSGIDGIETLEKIKKSWPATEVIMQTALGDAPTAVRALKAGAYDYLVKPAEPAQLVNLCLRACERKNLAQKNLILEAQLEQTKLGKILGQSKAIQSIFQTIRKVADSDVAVLIMGETGTGKELVAQAIHNEGKRKNKPFIAINCGGIPGDLLESELFGYEKGAFTSAEGTKIGKFELAQGGTIFLDEIGNMPKLMQAKLLRVLQEKEIERVGGTRPISVDVRIISATNEKLEEAIKAGNFRGDLFHRLNVIPIKLPALRERQEDIEILAKHFLQKYVRLYNGSFKTIAKETLNYLKKYSWPGNIRELEHLLQRIITLEEGATVLPKHLPPEVLAKRSKKSKK